MSMGVAEDAGPHAARDSQNPAKWYMPQGYGDLEIRHLARKELKCLHAQLREQAKLRGALFSALV